MARHSIDENWSWVVRDHEDGSKEIIGVAYPNGDRVTLDDMPSQQRAAYMRKAGLREGTPRTGRN